MPADTDKLADSLSLVNQDRYPTGPESRRCSTSLHQRTRRTIEERGYCVLPEFITEKTLRSLAAEATSLWPHATVNSRPNSIYAGGRRDQAFPQDHPRRMTMEETLHVVPYTEVPEASSIRRFFESRRVADFIGSLLGDFEVHRYGDELGALNILIMPEGDSKEWHFDHNDFTGSLLLQRPERGGVFEIAPNIRDAANENYELVKDVVLGSRSHVEAVRAEPATLVLFKGKRSLHRVTTVEGRVPRIAVVFAYDRRPGAKSSPYLSRSRYSD